MLWVSGEAQAACSGSGSTRTCAAGSTGAQIAAALGAVGSEGVVTLQNGTYTASNIGIDLIGNGVTLQCATVGGCTFTTSGTVITTDLTGCPASNITNLFRITGFTFTNNVNSIWIYCDIDFTKIRIDHNTVNLGGSDTFFLAGSSSPASQGAMYGVMDHNTFTSTTGNFQIMKNISNDDDPWEVGLIGSGNNFFVEDNVMTMTGGSYDAGFGCVDIWRGASMVIRFNTFTGCRFLSHGVMHGGPPAWEAYGNIIETPDGYRYVHHQGSGEWMAWGNRLNNPGSVRIALQHYRSSSNPNDDGTTHSCNGVLTTYPDGSRLPTTTYRGYPCYRQPGRNQNMSLRPVYIWDNKVDGSTLITEIEVTGYGDERYLSNHMQANRDYYLQGSSFNGTSGIGVGTLANRPATCTATPEAADAGNGGVGYWATDQGSWNQSATNPYGVQQSGADGVLYRCSATNTWTLAYTPYTYPHPLQGGTTDTTPPAAPENVYISRLKD